jgi:putative ABC transport system permease protein
VLSDDQNWSTQVTGTSPEFFEIRNWALASGAPFTASDVDGGNKVAVLGKTVSDKLFGPGVDPTGLTVRVNNVPFLVVGVLASKGQSPMGQDYDDVIVVPQSAFLAKIQGGLQKFIAGAIVVGAQPGQTGRAERQITALLRDRHRIPPDGDDDFSIRNLTEMAGAQQQGVSTITTLLAAIAAVSLVVGGIGIMNIMLVSVTERTREIGVRKAVGARRQDVLGQFLIEAVTLSLVGGAIGLALGYAIGAGVAAVLPGDWPPAHVPFWAVALAFGFSAVVGIFFGIYPASKASRLDPIEALRYE